MPGYVRVLRPRDIPIGGTNNVAVPPYGGYLPEEVKIMVNYILLDIHSLPCIQLLADYRSEYVGQAAAIVLAGNKTMS